MRVAGLTGGIAAGKSTATRLLRERGIPVIDCDAIAHHYTKIGGWGYRRVVAAFGPDVLLPSGELDRAKLGRLIFTDKALRKKLNQATHLPVALEIFKQIAWHWLCCRRVVVVDMPLLFETGMNKVFRPAILVYVTAGTQVRRLMARDQCTAEEALSKIKAQIPMEDKLKWADVVIDNEGSLQQLEAQVAQVSQSLLSGVRWWLSLLTSPIAVGAVLLLARAALLR